MARPDAPTESFGFDGREIPIHPGDTIGSALYRAGVDTVSAGEISAPATPLRGRID